MAKTTKAPIRGSDPTALPPKAIACPHGITVGIGPSGTVMARVSPRMSASLFPDQWARLFGFDPEDARATAQGFKALAEAPGTPQAIRAVASIVLAAMLLGEDAFKAEARKRALASGRYQEGEDGALVPVRGGGARTREARPAVKWADLFGADGE